VAIADVLRADDVEKIVKAKANPTEPAARRRRRDCEAMGDHPALASDR
jgi:hypothetical protein